MTSDTPEISVEDRSEKRRLVAAYVQHRLQLECGDDAPRGEASRIAKATGFSTAHVANAKNHGTVGADFAEAMASHWGMTLDGLRAAASEWGSATGFRVDAAAPADARRLRDLPTWPAAAERARLAVDEHDAPLVDEVGGFVPPAPIERVTVALVTALVTGWKGVRPSSAPTINHAPRRRPMSRGYARRARRGRSFAPGGATLTFVSKNT